MNITLTYPRFEPNPNMPLGIAYIASNLQKNGFKPQILDQHTLDWQLVRKTLQEQKPDLLGISVVSATYPNSLKLAAIAKELNPECFVVFGNALTSVLPERAIKEKNVDAVAIGEGEETFVEIAKRIEAGKSLKGVKGTWYRESGRVEKNAPRPFIEDLNSLPFPAWNLFPTLKEYLHYRGGKTAWALQTPALTIITTRGCPGRCTFCATHAVFGRSIRFRSPENIVAEIKEMKHLFGIRSLNIWDDTFTINRERNRRLYDLMIKEGLGIEWSCQERVNLVDLESLQLMKKAGCRSISYGVESGVQRVLDNFVKKDIKIEQVKRAVSLTEKAGIICQAYFMLGIPGETKEEMNQTIKFAYGLNPDIVQFCITTPFPGTELEEMIDSGMGKWITHDFTKRNVLGGNVFETSEWTADYVRKLSQKATVGFYTRPRYLLSQLLKVRSFRDLASKYYGFWTMMKQLRTPAAKQEPEESEVG